MVKFPDICTAVTLFFFFFLIQVISLLISQAVHKSPMETAGAGAAVSEVIVYQERPL